MIGCVCNSKGSTKTDNSNCINKCCNNDGSCKCLPGYSGTDCNSCQNGYFVSAVANGEVECTGNIKYGLKNFNVIDVIWSQR